jgi:hypothetical protein
MYLEVLKKSIFIQRFDAGEIGTDPGHAVSNKNILIELNGNPNDLIYSIYRIFYLICIFNTFGISNIPALLTIKTVLLS